MRCKNQLGKYVKINIINGGIEYPTWDGRLEYCSKSNRFYCIDMDSGIILTFPESKIVKVKKDTIWLE